MYNPQVFSVALSLPPNLAAKDEKPEESLHAKVFEKDDAILWVKDDFDGNYVVLKVLLKHHMKALH